MLIDGSHPDAAHPDAPPLAVISRPLGIQTNNFAEYTAVVLALRRAHELGADEVELVLDSKLIVEQLAGRWKIRHPQIVPLAVQAQSELRRLRRWSIRHEPRANNRAADALANLALDDPRAAATAETVRPPNAAEPGDPPPAPTPAPRGSGTPRAPTEIAAYLDDLLMAAKFRPTEPENGLVVDGGRPVDLVGAAVNTSFTAIEAAAAAGAQLLLVHHTSWPYIDRSLHEPKVARCRELGLSMYCAHASLDGADMIGTGFALAGLVGIEVEGRFAEYEGALAGVHGRWQGSLDNLVAAVRRSIGGEPEVIRATGGCSHVGIVPGAGGLTGWLDEARGLGCDTYLTGEGSMYTRLFARESGLNLIVAGHYRTEAPGIRGLAAQTSDALGVAWTFVDDEPIG